MVKILTNFRSPKILGYNTYRMKIKHGVENILDSPMKDVQANCTRRV
jgi:hypothetical protein